MKWNGGVRLSFTKDHMGNWESPTRQPQRHAPGSSKCRLNHLFHVPEPECRRLSDGWLGEIFS